MALIGSLSLDENSLNKDKVTCSKTHVLALEKVGYTYKNAIASYIEAAHSPPHDL
jgi:hypothetical protein